MACHAVQNLFRRTMNKSQTWQANSTPSKSRWRAVCNPSPVRWLYLEKSRKRLAKSQNQQIGFWNLAMISTNCTTSCSLHFDAAALAKYCLKPAFSSIAGEIFPHAVLLSNNTRVDAVLFLGQRILPVDSKFPLQGFDGDESENHKTKVRLCGW